MEFPLWALLIPFGLVVAITSLYVFFNIYHLYAFGVAKTGTTGLIAIYVLGYLAVALLSASLIASVDWSSTISVGDIFSGSSKNRILDL